MEKFTLNAQEHIIRNILESLENSIAGMGIARSWEYKCISERTIEFILKEGEEIKPSDLFWFGYYTPID